MRTRTLVLTLAVLAFAVPADAIAKLPAKGGKLIVPSSSIGGVKLGMKASVAAKKWGKGGSCDESTVGALSCRYDGTAKEGTARFDIDRDGKVVAIYFESGHKQDGTAIYKGPITKWHTKKGIRIGSLLRKVQKKYPKAKPGGGGLVLTTRKSSTFFDSSGGRTYRISIVAASAL
jgi:hypothetical protein